MTRKEQPPDVEPISRLEVYFYLPVYATSKQLRALHDVIDDIVKSECNQPEDGIHWVSGCGSKPIWSQNDQAFLGKDVNQDAPVSGEPTFDHSTYAIETYSRPFNSDKEREKHKKKE